MRLVRDVGTKLATCDPESHRIARTEDGSVYFSFIDKDGDVYVAESYEPGVLDAQWAVRCIFGRKGLLADLKAAKFGASLAIDRTHDELSLAVCEKTTNSCVYSRCRLRGSGTIMNPKNWFAQGKSNPSTVGFAKVGSIGEGGQSLCAVEHDGMGNAIVSFSAFQQNTFSVKFTKFQDQWLKSITIDEDENYCWASSLYLDRDDDLHIAYESYRDNAVRHRQARLNQCMNPAEWRSASGDSDFDHSLHHNTKPCRAFSMCGDAHGRIHFVGHTAPQRNATTDILYNTLDTKSGKWLFEEGESCGKISSVGYFGTYGYPQVGILKDIPVIAYTREGNDGRLHITRDFGKEVYAGPKRTYYPCLERESTTELNVIFTRKSLLTYDILGLTIS